MKKSSVHNFLSLLLQVLLSNVAKVTLPHDGKPLLETETNYLQIKLSYAIKANFKF